MTPQDDAIRRAARAIRDADALLVTAGAGMGVDSGLPDFRGPEGFWRAYPPYRALGLNFVDLANPGAFARKPQLAWGFYGHRLTLYRATTPHAGFARLLRWATAKPAGYFVFTSNVDGHFQAAGFGPEHVVECHGSIHHLQCGGPCCDDVWPAADLRVAVDEATMRAGAPLPTCPRCGGLARPNVLMFGDPCWVGDRTDAGDARYRRWLTSLAGRRLTVIECGAGRAVPTVRRESERLVRAHHATLVRVNPTDHDVPPGQIAIASGAGAALEQIGLALDRLDADD